MTRGEFLALQLDKQDSLERPRKYSTFLLTRYPPRLKNYLVFIPLAGFIRTAHPLIDWLLPGVFLRHHRQLLLSVSFHASHHVNYAKCRMSNHGVTNVGALATFPDTALHLRSVPGVQVHMTRAPAFTVPLPLLLPQLHVKTHHPRLMRNGNVQDVTCLE